VAVAVFTQDEWTSFCDVLKKPGWIQDGRFSTLVARKNNEDELERLIGEWTAQHTAEQIEAMMQEKGVAANVVETGKDVYEDAQLNHYGHFKEMDHPEIGKIRSEIPPLKFSKVSDNHFRAPLLGEHNHFVLSEFLGMTDDQISELYASGVITTDADLPGEKG
jgi:benzylsuccinate CoA-transferase BbsF subunit